MNAEEIFEEMWSQYANAVNANDGRAYGRLFTEHAVRMVPGASPEWGREAIESNEADDYVLNHWQISPTPLDAISLGPDWIYGIARVRAEITSYSVRSLTVKSITAAWLLHHSPAGGWLIHRHILNVESESVG